MIRVNRVNVSECWRAIVWKCGAKRVGQEMTTWQTLMTTMAGHGIRGKQLCRLHMQMQPDPIQKWGNHFENWSSDTHELTQLSCFWQNKRVHTAEFSDLRNSCWTSAAAAMIIKRAAIPLYGCRIENASAPSCAKYKTLSCDENQQKKKQRRRRREKNNRVPCGWTAHSRKGPHCSMQYAPCSVRCDAIFLCIGFCLPFLSLDSALQPVIDHVGSGRTKYI